MPSPLLALDPANADIAVHHSSVVPRRIVDVDTLSRNAELVRASVLSETKIYWVLKADAYGHTFSAALQALRTASDTVVVVDSPREAYAVRDLQHQGEILVLSTSDHRSLLACKESRATATLSSLVAVEAWVALPDRLRPEAHVQLDTGMQRCGIPAREDSKLLRMLSTLGTKSRPHLSGVLSHAPDWHATDIARATNEFATRAASLQNALGHSLIRHMGASAAIHPEQRWNFDAIRVGDAFYGIADALQHPTLVQRIQPAIRYEAQVINTSAYVPNTPIGYSGRSADVTGASYFTLRVGYSDLPFLKMVPEVLSIRLPSGSLAKLMDVAMHHSIFLTDGKAPSPNEWLAFLGGKDCPSRNRLHLTSDGIAPSFIHATSSITSS